MCGHVWIFQTQTGWASPSSPSSLRDLSLPGRTSRQPQCDFIRHSRIEGICRFFIHPFQACNGGRTKPQGRFSGANIDGLLSCKEHSESPCEILQLENMSQRFATCKSRSYCSKNKFDFNHRDTVTPDVMILDDKFPPSYEFWARLTLLKQFQ